MGNAVQCSSLWFPNKGVRRSPLVGIMGTPAGGCNGYSYLCSHHSYCEQALILFHYT